MAFSRTGSTDCMIPSLLSISLIYGCMPSMAFIFLATSTSGCPSSSLLRILAVRAFWMFLMAAVLATAASPSPLASEERAEERVDSRLTRSSSSFMESYWLAETAAMAARAKNFICKVKKLIIKNYNYKQPELFIIKHSELKSNELSMRKFFTYSGFWGFGEIGRASCRERVSDLV